MAISELKRHQWTCFALAWLAYIGILVLRKPLGVVKHAMSEELHFSSVKLGMLDTCMLLPYAFAQMLLSSLGDQMPVRYGLGFCLIGTALSNMTFGWWSSEYILGTLLFLSGLSQALAWPLCVKSVSLWYAEEERSKIFGIYGTCMFVGGLASTALAVELQRRFGWRQVFFAPSVAVAALGAIIIVLMRMPQEVGIVMSTGTSVDDEEEAKESFDSGVEAVRPKGATMGPSPSFFILWKQPLVAITAIGCLCMKVIRYSQYMWLPLYMVKTRGYSDSASGWFSTTYEIGGVFGSVFISVFIDRVAGGRAVTAASYLFLLSVIALLLFIVAGGVHIALATVFMCAIGVFSCGLDPIITGMMPSALSEQTETDTRAAVAGLVSGFGGLGAVLQGPVIGGMADLFGWSSSFYIVVILSFVGIILMRQGASQRLSKLLS